MLQLIAAAETLGSGETSLPTLFGFQLSAQRKWVRAPTESGVSAAHASVPQPTAPSFFPVVPGRTLNIYIDIDWSVPDVGDPRVRDAIDI